MQFAELRRSLGLLPIRMREADRKQFAQLFRIERVEADLEVKAAQYRLIKLVAIKAA